MGALSDVVTITVSLQAVTPMAAGFGEPMVVSAGDAPVGFTQRTRHYAGPGPTALAQMVTDGWAVTSPTYLAVESAYEQNPSPVSVCVGRFVNLPTQVCILTPTYISGYNYNVYIDGQLATAAGITNLATTCAAIATAINALTFSPAHLTATGESTYVKIVCADAGEWHHYACFDLSGNLELTMINGTTNDHTDGANLSNSGTVSAELAAIALYDSSWYALNMDAWATASIIGDGTSGSAKWTEANLKLQVTQTADQPCANNAESSGSDIMQTLQTASYTRTALLFGPDAGSFAGIAWLGARLPYAPGSENWKFVTLAGVASSNLTATQVINIKAKNGNYYYTVGGVAITANGQTASGQWIDIIRGIDWFDATLQANIFNVLQSTGQKVPFTDAGVAQIESEVRGMITLGQSVGFIATTPAPTVLATPVAQLNPTDVANRLLKGLSFGFTVQGAVDTVNVTGTVLQ